MCLQPGNAIPSELNAPNAHLWFQLWLQGMVFKLFTSGYAVWSFTSFGISNMVLTLEEHYMWETHGQEWEESTLRGRRWRKWISRTALVPVTARLFHEASVCSVVFDSLRPMDCSLPGSYVHGIFPQEYWSGLSFRPPGDLLDPGIKLTSPVL